MSSSDVGNSPAKNISFIGEEHGVFLPRGRIESIDDNLSFSVVDYTDMILHNNPMSWINKESEYER